MNRPTGTTLAGIVDDAEKNKETFNLLSSDPDVAQVMNERIPSSLITIMYNCEVRTIKPYPQLKQVLNYNEIN